MHWVHSNCNKPTLFIGLWQLVDHDWFEPWTIVLRISVGWIAIMLLTSSHPAFYLRRLYSLGTLNPWRKAAAISQRVCNFSVHRSDSGLCCNDFQSEWKRTGHLFPFPFNLQCEWCNVLPHFFSPGFSLAFTVKNKLEKAWTKNTSVSSIERDRAGYFYKCVYKWLESNHLVCISFSLEHLREAAFN